MKYDFELSLDEHTSVGKIVSQIKDHSSVLEFGPGNGRMTRYLISEKKCSVSIVEFDQELYENVMKYAHDGFLGDIEKYDWTEYFDGKKYDYIVFADVLEHLSNPELTLEKVIPFLAKDGKLLITFPNIAHNSVLIDLFNNKLDWNQYGLLDKTHNTFYTQSGFEKLFGRLGLNIAIEDYTYSQVGQNEIQAFYEDLPISSQYDFKNRLFGEVYQYFYVLQTAPVSNAVRNIPENSNFVKQLRLEYNHPTKVEKAMLLMNNYTGEGKDQLLTIPTDLKSLKIFPANNPSIVRFKAISANKEIRKIETNAVWNSENIFIFQDANGYLSIDGSLINKNELNVVFDFIYDGVYSEIQELLFAYIQKQNREVKKLRDVLLKSEQENNLKQEIMFQRFNEVTKQLDSSKWFTKKSTPKAEREKLITIKIESIDNDEELNTAIVKGWGYSNQTKEPLRYDLQSNEGAYFKVTPLNRQDVIEVCDLPKGNKYGFIIEIENFQIAKYLHMIISTTNNEKVYMKINRYNLSEANVMQRSRYLLGSLRQKGLINTIKAYKERRQQQNWYDNWIAENEQFDQESIISEIASWSFQPKISIVVPVYNIEEKWLKICIESLQKQFYSNWELCIADDASTESYIKPFLEKNMEEDSRIKVVFREKNGHISEATNSALGIATGEYIGFMDNDDELAPNALYEVVKALNEDPKIDFLYTDEDKIDVRGKRFDPFFKPNWNEELLLGHNYITHFVVAKRDLVIVQVGGLRDEFNGSQDYDFVLRATEKATKIYHIPKVLYHWRTVETSVAFDPQSKEYAYIAGQKALKEALKRRKLSGEVQMTKNFGAYKINYKFTVNPKVSVIFTGDNDLIEKNLKKFLEKTYYDNVEFLIPSSLKNKLAPIDRRLKFVDTLSLNQQAFTTEGEFICFINSGVIPKNSSWLDELINLGQKNDVGIVGGKIIDAFDTILNVGVAIDEKKCEVIYEQRGVSNKSIGYYFRPVLPRELFAVTEDCCLIRKAVFEDVGGFDENLGSHLTGIDLSRKVYLTSKKVLFSPYSEMIATSNLFSLSGKKNAKRLVDKFSSDQLKDIYKNPNFIS